MLNATNWPFVSPPLITSSEPTSRNSANEAKLTSCSDALVGEHEELGAEDRAASGVWKRFSISRRSESSAASAFTVSMPRIASIWPDE